MTFSGSAASAGLRVGSPTGVGNCSSVVNIPPNCDTTL